MELKINPAFRDLCPEPTPEEFAQLEANIVGLGRVREEILLWNNAIVDGHTRHKIATKHNIPFDTAKIDFESEQAAKNWIIDNQLGRRNLSDSQRAMLAAKKVTTKLGSNQSGSANLQTQAETAEKAGVSVRTLASAVHVAEAKDTSLEKAVVNGKIAVNVAEAVAKLPAKERPAFESGAVKGTAKAIKALAKKDEGERAQIVRDARTSGKTVDEALGMKGKTAKPKAAEKGDAWEPPAEAKRGKPTIDVRKFKEMETEVGKLVRLNTALKDHCGCGIDHHENIRQNLNDILGTLSTWRLEVGAA